MRAGVKKPAGEGRSSLAGAVKPEELIRALVSSAGTGIYIVQDGKFQYCNTLFQELTGYKEDDLIGMYSLDFVHPDDKAKVRKKAIENLKGHALYPYVYSIVKPGYGAVQNKTKEA